MENVNQRVSNQVNSDEKEFDLGLFFRKILSDWWIFLISLAVFGTIAFLFIHYSTPTFRINAKLLINDENKSSSMVASDLMDLSALMGIKSNVDNEAEVLQTKSLMEKVVRDLQLNITFFRKGSIRDVELNEPPFVMRRVDLKDSLEATKVDISNVNNKGFTISYVNAITSSPATQRIKYGQLFKIEDVGLFQFDEKPVYSQDTIDEYILDLRSVDEKVTSLQEATTISVTNTNVSTIDLSLIYPLPKKGENILKSLLENYVEQNIREKNRIADSTIDFIENRLIYVGNELGNIEGNIQTFKQNNKLADLSEQSKLLISQSGDVIKQQAEIETQLSIIDALTSLLKSKSGSKKVISASLLSEDPVFASLVDRYNAKILDLERLLLTSTPTNPFVVSLEDQITALHSAIISNMASNRNSLVIKKRQLLANSGKLSGAIHEVPAQERTFFDLSRQQQIKQELYVYLLQKREETAISKTSNISNSQTIDPPKSEFEPISPKKVLILAFAILVAMILPVIRIIMYDVLNKRILTKEDIENRTQVPIVGEISHNKSNENLIVLSNTRSPIAEQFRALRTNIQFYLNDENEKVILFTSSMSGEGKSFSSINFANVLAISGKRVVIMELDLRKPKISNQLGLSNKFGFSNYIISKEVKTTDILSSTKANENLFVISSGPIPPNPAELLLHERTTKLIDDLKTMFDYVIIDSPPLGLVTDAQLLSKNSDLTLYLVRQKYTFKDQLSIPEELYQTQRMKKIAIVVNDIQMEKGYGYGYGYGSAYGYGYGYYDSDGDEKKSLGKKIRTVFNKS